MPAAEDELSEIQRLQHHDVHDAERRTRNWLHAALGLEVAAVTLRPQPTSLNSFNGIAVVNGHELFFKSHNEPESTIKEYYNSHILHEAGYNIVLPVYSEHREGQQIAFYPVVTWPVMFDLMRQVERGQPSAVTADQLIKAEERECAQLLDIYRATARRTEALEHAKAPVHQLFWHRLAGSRFKRFYNGRQLALPGGLVVEVSEILGTQWVINGVEQPRTFGELIAEARRVLAPAQGALTVVGHADAHFGNVFLQEGERFLYFDPAFAGRHSPLLDVAKPLFHNVFAQWMYFPNEKTSEIPVRVTRGVAGISVDYGNAFPTLRQSLLGVKRRALIEPLVAWLLDQKALPYGRRPLELALMCCPLLTMNLTDRAKFPPPVSWLGLALALQMGNWDVEQDFAFCIAEAASPPSTEEDASR
jgi:hypothetical protein